MGAIAIDMSVMYIVTVFTQNMLFVTNLKEK